MQTRFNGNDSSPNLDVVVDPNSSHILPPITLPTLDNTPTDPYDPFAVVANEVE
jgi:hypothetical protein